MANSNIARKKMGQDSKMKAMVGKKVKKESEVH